MTWWHTPLDQVNGRMENSVYDSEGTVVFGYTLFALGLALAVGVVWRRTVPAVVTTFVGYFAARIFVDTWLRQRLVSPLTATWLSGPTPAGNGPASLSHAWVLFEGPSDKLGHVTPFPVEPCAPASGHHVASLTINGNCLPNFPRYMHAVYQPPSHFWPLQGIETAIFGLTALALITFAAWWTHQRTA